MPIVARCNGTVLVEDGDRLGVVEQGGSWIPVTIFVCGLLGVILLVNGVVTLFAAGLVGLALLGAAILAIAAVFGLLRLRRRKGDAPPPAPWLVFDAGTRTVVDAHGARIAIFDGVTLERAFQAGSSSKALVVRHPGGRVVVARGNPFGDSVDAVEQAIRRRLA